MKFRGGLTLFLVVLLLLFQICPIFTVSAYAAERNADLDIITSVAVTDRNGDPLPSDVDKNAECRIAYTWTIPDGSTGNGGDTFTLDVPDEFLLDQDLTVYMEIGEGEDTELIATAFLDHIARTITITFEANAFYYFDVSGEFWFDLSFDGDNIGTDDPYDVIFYIGQGVDPITVPIDFYQPPPPEATILKSRNYNAATKEITWTLTLNEEGATIGEMRVEDTISAEHEYVPDSVTINGAPASALDYSYDSGSRTLTYNFTGEITTEQVITYKTTVLNSAMLAVPDDQDDLIITNTADLIADGYTIPSNIATVEIPVNLLAKTRSYSSANQAITWTLRVNESDLTILNAMVADTLPNGLTLDTGTVTDNGSPMFEGTGDGTFSISGQDLTFYLGDISEEHVIVFVTDVDTSNYLTQSNENFTNTATLTGTDVIANNTASAGITPNTRIIDKSGTGYDPATGRITWEINVNSYEESLDDVVISDLISANQAYVIGSFEIVDDIGTPYTGGNLTTETTDEIVYTFPANITGEYTITFETQVTDPDIYEANYNQTHSNTASVSLSNGTGGTESGTQRVTSVVLTKESGSYDYVTRQMTWQLEINENKNALDNVTVTDTIPADQAFVASSFYVVDSGGIPYDVGNTNLIYDTNTFTYTFPGTINDTYTITFNTEFIDLDSLYQNQTMTISNSASMNHDALSSPVTTNTTGDFDSEVVSKGHDYIDDTDYIDWEVIINRNRLTYNSALVQDTFQEGLALDTSSIELYNVTVNADNSVTIGSQVAITGDNIDYDLDTRTLYFIMPSPITTAYALVFRTYVTDKSLSPFSNSATVEADGVPPEEEGDEEDVAVSFAGAGGSATGSVGSLTVTKADIADPGILLAGAVFELIDQYDIVVDRVTTDSNGEAFFDRLRFDVPYTVKEVTPPEGYLPSLAGTEEYSFTINTGDPETNITHPFYNEQIIGNIEFTKLDENSDPLSGAEFTLYEDDNPTSYTATSDGTGTVTFSNIPYGDYVIKETDAPTGYAISITEPTVSVVTHGATATPSPSSITNRLVISDITFTKLDEESDPLAGAVFTLYDDGDNVVTTATSGADGVVLFEDIDYGDYTIRETTAPDGYTRSNTVHNASVTTDGATITLTSPDFTNQPLNASITFTKLDPEDSGLPGAVFTLYDSGSTAVDTATSAIDGTVTFSDVAPGDYTIEETTTPTGYVTNATVLTATVVDDVGDAVVTATPATITNAYILGTILLSKLDNSGDPLAGAEFTLYDSGDTAVDTAVSDASGLVTFTDVRYGSYTIRETDAPEGYLPTIDEFTATITTNGEVVNASPDSASNTQIEGDIEFQKVDESNDPLENCEFALYAASDPEFASPLATATSDATGTVNFADVIYGDYVIAETSVPTGYVLSTDTLTASIRTHGETADTTPATFVNELIRVDLVVRLVNTNGARLRGGIIALFDSEGTQIDSGTTDENGVVVFSNVLYGTYTIRQLSAPSGYILSDTEIPVNVDSDLEEIDAGEIVDLRIASDSVRTGDNITIYIVGFIAALVLLALIVILIMIRRRKQQMNRFDK